MREKKETASNTSAYSLFSDSLNPLTVILARPEGFEPPAYRFVV